MLSSLSCHDVTPRTRRPFHLVWSTVAVLFAAGGWWPTPASAQAPVAADRPVDLWRLAQQQSHVHRFATLFTAHDVQERLATPEGLDEAVRWCKEAGITHVFLEVFRSRVWADRDTLVRAKKRFQKEGFVVGGGVTTTFVGKRSTGWNLISCYTDKPTQETLEKIFRYAASLFDVIMIDDFWFTDCQCEECRRAKGDRSWSEYRLELMNRLSRDRVIGPAKAVNPRAELIIKFPQWYERFHERGYDMARQPKLFDWTWIGTETRDPDNARWGMLPQYGAYWISQWTRAVSGRKFAGGWFDPLGTTPKTYVEQARQTILGQCPESLLFCYGALHRDHGPEDLAAFRAEMPKLLELAAFVHGERPRGVASFKPPNSDAGNDAYLFNFLGMTGIPLTAGGAFPEKVPSLLLTEHALAEPNLTQKIDQALADHTVLLVTSNLLQRLPEPLRDRLRASRSVHVLTLPAEKKSRYGVLASIRQLPERPQEELDGLRRPLLEPLGVQFSAPGNVSLYLFGDKKVVVENFRDEPARVRVALKDGRRLHLALVLPPGAQVQTEVRGSDSWLVLPARSLVALTAQ